MWRASTLTFLKNDHPLVMAHRGNSAEVPENTREAFEDAARLQGVDVIETDTYLTSDDNFVFFHDPRLQRTTNGRGNIKARTLAELKTLDAGYNFEDDEGGHPFRGKGFAIQSIDEILSQFPDQRFNIDIKSKDPRAPSLLAKKLVDLGIEDGPGSRVLVASFWNDQIRRFRASSHIPTSASTGEVISFRGRLHKWMKKHPGDHVEGLTQEIVLGKEVDYVALQIPERFWILTVINGPRFVAIAHELGIAVHVWTINEQEKMDRLLQWGVDGIFSDRPGLLIEVIHHVNF
ncbi:MAG TPA: glycerophosphodiester phosphodiesterase [Candidatus Lokiarchaeia archaeon]|nr:glycerophosphodiester phosphodiesterase [Candidatus Lokiarchaeia archaeon]